MDSKQLVAELIKGNVEEFKKGFSELLAERIEEKMCKLRAESLSDVGLKILGDEEVEPELEDGQEMLTEPESEDEEEIEVEGEVDVEDGDLESDEEEDLEVEPEEGEEPELESDEESEDDAEEIEDADDVEDTQVVSVDVDDDVSQVRVELQLSDEEDE